MRKLDTPQCQTKFIILLETLEEFKRIIIILLIVKKNKKSKNELYYFFFIIRLKYLKKILFLLLKFRLRFYLFSFADYGILN